MRQAVAVEPGEARLDDRGCQSAAPVVAVCTDALDLGIPVARVDERLAARDVAAVFPDDREVELREIDRAFAGIPVRQPVDFGEFRPVLERIELQEPFPVPVRIPAHVDHPEAGRKRDLAGSGVAQQVLLRDRGRPVRLETRFAQEVADAGLVLVDLGRERTAVGPVGGDPAKDLIKQEVISARCEYRELRTTVLRHDEARQRAERVEPQVRVVPQEARDILLFRPDPVLPVAKTSMGPDEVAPVAVVVGQERPHALKIVAPVLIGSVHRFHENRLPPTALRVSTCL